MMFLFWSSFYSKNVIHFHQREIAIVSFSYCFIWWTKFHFYLYFVCQFIDRCQWSSLTITESFLFFWRSYQSIGNHFFLDPFEVKGNKFVVFFYWVVLDTLLLMVQYTTSILDFPFLILIIVRVPLWTVSRPKLKQGPWALLL